MLVDTTASSPTPKQSLDRVETPPSRPSTLMGFMMLLSDFSSTLITSTQAYESTNDSETSESTSVKRNREKIAIGEFDKGVVTVTHLESSDSWRNGPENKTARDGSGTRKRRAGFSGCFCGFSSGQE